MSDMKSHASAPVTDTASQKATDTVNNLSEHIADAEARIREAADNAIATLGDKSVELERKATEIGNDVNRYVRANPLQALGIAFVGGILFSALTRKR